jgi:O-antigen/teichoic acid export membrane protein
MIDRFFVARYGTEGDVGVYSLANSLVLVISVLITVPVGQVWSVMRFSVMNEEGAAEYYSKVLTYVTMASMFLALLLASVAGDALLLKGDRSYWRCANIIPMLAFAAVFESGSQVLNVGITLRRRTVFSPMITGLALAVNVSLNFLLIPRYGVMGASISTLLSYMAFCCIRFIISKRFFKVEYEWVRVFNSVAIGGLLLLGFYLIDYYRGPEPRTRTIAYSMLFKLMLALSFPVLLYLAGFYQKRELQRLSQLARKLRHASVQTGDTPLPPSPATSNGAVAEARSDVIAQTKTQ